MHEPNTRSGMAVATSSAPKVARVLDPSKPHARLRRSAGRHGAAPRGAVVTGGGGVQGSREGRKVGGPGARLQLAGGRGQHQPPSGTRFRRRGRQRGPVPRQLCQQAVRSFEPTTRHLGYGAPQCLSLPVPVRCVPACHAGSAIAECAAWQSRDACAAPRLPSHDLGPCRSRFGRHVHIPEVHRGASSRRVITMEYCEGASVREPAALRTCSCAAAPAATCSSCSLTTASTGTMPVHACDPSQSQPRTRPPHHTLAPNPTTQLCTVSCGRSSPPQTRLRAGAPH